jgi:signal transduction histidine kinase
MNRDEIRFSVESAILRELGEQLVSSSEVALTELIKNSYDADATSCNVEWSDSRIVVKDTGHGMSLDDFKNKWMRIATGNKAGSPTSKVFGRTITGSKGIGRFATRFLGKTLLLITVYENKCGDRSKIVARFNWEKVDSQSSIDSLIISYRLYNRVEDSAGTTLVIKNLRHKFDYKKIKQIKDSTLSMVSPIDALLSDAPYDFKLKHSYKSKREVSSEESDKFNLNFIVPGDKTEKRKSEVDNIADDVLKSYLFRSYFYTNGNNLFMKVLHRDKGLCDEVKIPIKNLMGCDIYGQVNYFPSRKGMLRNGTINGNKARAWIRNSPSVAVYDKSFKVPPYGEIDDDWLSLNADSSRSERHWRSPFMKEHYEMSTEQRTSPKLNPMLALPETHQLVGGVFIEASNARITDDIKSLSPSTDRQGLVENEGFQQLNDICRFSIELVAYHDKKYSLDEEEERKKRDYERAQDEIDEVIDLIENTSTLSQEDKEALTSKYSSLRNDYDKLIDHERKTRENFVNMGLLGVVAGFMTHEFKSTLHLLEETLDRVKFLEANYPELSGHSQKLDESLSAFLAYTEYTESFIESINFSNEVYFRAFPQIQDVVNSFSKFRLERDIDIDMIDVDRDVYAPKMPVAVYKGIIHNLYTNALKALVSESKENKCIKISTLNRKNSHFIRVSDNGAGIPPGTRRLIWDPLYTTTSNENNPLGSGMGLGLPLVKQIIEKLGGRIELVSPENGFATTFEIELPVK